MAILTETLVPYLQNNEFVEINIIIKNNVFLSDIRKKT